MVDCSNYFFSCLQQVPPELENAKALIVLSLSHNK